MKKNPEVIKTLLKAGAKINDRNADGYTALMIAAQNNENPEIISTYLKAGANVNDQNNFKSTALTLAAEFNKNPEIVVELLNHGANAKLRDYDGKSAFDYVSANPNLKDSDAYWELNNARF